MNDKNIKKSFTREKSGCESPTITQRLADKPEILEEWNKFKEVVELRKKIKLQKCDSSEEFKDIEDEFKEDEIKEKNFRSMKKRYSCQQIESISKNLKF